MAGTTGPLPRGVVTFLLTDIEGSTQLWDRDATAMHAALSRHDAIMHDAVAAAGGRVLKERGEGDSTFSVFERPSDAAVAALHARRALTIEPWPATCPIEVRFAIHIGEVETRDGDYYGTAVNRAARVRGLAVGGQILVSEAAAALVSDHLPDDATLVALGEQQLRGLQRAEHVFALVDARRPLPEAIGGVSPYRGLLAFQPEDRAFYFGRERLVDALVARLVAHHFLVVVGASGSGKSSLVRAGIVATLRSGALPGSAAWDCCILTPGGHPLAALAAAGENLDARRDAPSVLVIDQMEELFTSCDDAAERAAFVDAVLDVITHGDGRVLVVCALRADFYGHCASIPGFAAAVSDATVLLGPMDDTELRRAIEAPAEVAGLRVEAGLVDLVLRDLAHEPGSLPLLSHALLETWRRREGRTLTLDGYEHAGGVRGAIARTAETVWTSLDAEQQRTAHRIFVRLTELGEGTEDTRRRVERDELDTAAADAEAVDEVLGVLANARLVTLDEHTVEVAHEALIREWPRLRQWLDDDRDAIRVHRHLTRAARDWDAIGRDRGELYRGPRLLAARERLGASDAVQLNALESEFLRASTDADEAEQRAEADRAAARERANRRLRAVLAATALILVVALIAGVVAFRQRNNAEHATERERAATLSAQVDRIVAEVPTLLKSDRSLASVLAVEAARLRPDPRTRGLVLSTLLDEPRLRRTLYGGGRGYSDVVAVSAGRSVVAVRGDGVDLWDLATGRVARRIDGVRATAIAATKTGDLVAIASEGGSVSFWDARLRRVGAAVTIGARPSHVEFSPDGSRLAVAFGFGGGVPAAIARNARIVDVARRAVVGSIPGDGPAINTVAYSHDGRWIATGADDGSVVLHDARTGAAGPSFDFGLAVWDLAFSPDDRFVATGTIGSGPDRPSAAVFDVATGRRLGAALSGFSGAARVLFLDDGRLVVTGGDGHVDVRRMPDVALLLRFDAQHGPASATAAAAGLVVAGFDGTLTIWGPDDTAPATRLVPGSPREAGFFSPDGTTLALADQADSVWLYDAASLRPTGRLSVSGAGARPEQSLPTAMAFTADSHRIALGDRFGRIRVFDVATRTPVGPVVQVGSRACLIVATVGCPVSGLAFSPDGRVLLAAGNLEARNGARVVDTTTWSVHDVEPAIPFAFSSSWSHDGSRVVIWSAAAGGGAVFRVEGGRVERGSYIERPGDNHLAATFSPSGRLLVVGALNGSLELRDATTFRHIGSPIEVSGQGLGCCSFGRDDRYAVAQDLAKRVVIIDLGARAVLGTFRGLADGFSSASFSPDGRLVTLPSPRGTLLLAFDVDAWSAAACARAGRSLTRAERDRYLSAAGHHAAACASS